MELLLTILMLLGLHSNPEQLSNTKYREDHLEKITKAEQIILLTKYHYDENGIVIIEDGTGDLQ